MSEEKKHYQRPLNFKTGKVEMNFGAGGKASAQLIADLFAKYWCFYCRLDLESD